MVSFQTIEVAGFLPAIAGMRHPLKSYNKADSKHDEEGNIRIGKNDYDLARRLCQAGSPEHAKFLRQIQVWVNITAPRFWWAEEATYKIGTVENSQSTMHTLIRDGIKEEDVAFNFGENNIDLADDNMFDFIDNVMRDYLSNLDLIINYYKTIDSNKKDIKDQCFEKIKAMLPEGFFQTRMVSLNYEVLRNMYRQRKNHRLSGWNTDFVNWIETLPMSEWITGNFSEPKNVIDE